MLPMQLKTNQRRGGGLELIMQTRTDDRHRLMAAIANLTPSPLARVVQDIVQPPAAPPRVRHTSAAALDGSYPRSRPNLSLSDLESVCAACNTMREGDDEPVTTVARYRSGSSYTIIDSPITDVSSFDVGGVMLKPRNDRNGPNSDPSACFVTYKDEFRFGIKFKAKAKRKVLDIRPAPSITIADENGHVVEAPEPEDGDREDEVEEPTGAGVGVIARTRAAQGSYEDEVSGSDNHAEDEADTEAAAKGDDDALVDGEDEDNAYNSDMEPSPSEVGSDDRFGSYLLTEAQWRQFERL
ncbi:unnamed protein product [Tilletia controversa]|nr:unnamed protein product [Tilletia controversa]